MTMTDDRALHPIAQIVITSLEAFEGGHYALSQPGGERLQRVLQGLFNKQELRPAVVSLITVAKFLEDHGQRKAADQVLWIAGTAADALRKLGAGAAKLASDLSEMTQAKFASFKGGDKSRHAAPKVDAKKEEGTVTVAAFKAVRPLRA